MIPKRSARRKKANAVTSTPPTDTSLLGELRGMIALTREGVARTVDAAPDNVT